MESEDLKNICEGEIMILSSKFRFNKNRGEVLRDIAAKYKEGELYAPITGDYIPLEEVPDGVFASGMLGKGCGIIPAEGKVYSPIEGKIVMLADTKHAVGIQNKGGQCIVIHIGMETIETGGKGFFANVVMGQEVSCGTLLITFDIKKILRAGLDITTAMVRVDEGDCSKEIYVDSMGYHKAGNVIGKIK